MNKRLIALGFIVMLALVGCSDNNSNDAKFGSRNVKTSSVEKQASEEDSVKLVVEYGEDKEHLKSYYKLPHIKEFYSWQGLEFEEPPVLSYPRDLSTLSYEDLRLLRNEIFARNGYLFNDGYLRGYFNRFKWYMPIFDVSDFKIVFNSSEQKLIDEILAEEANRKKNKTINQNGLKLYNTELIINSKQFERIPQKVKEDFAKQNFSIVNANRGLPFYIYDQNAYDYVPHYITTDLYLFILHKYFSSFLEKLDEDYMYNQLLNILRASSLELEALSNSQNQKAIDWAKMYTAVAMYAIGENPSNVPQAYSSIFETEKKNIDNMEGKPTFIKNNFVTYDELKPRGHYTKTEILQNYFRSFKWISSNGIDLSKDDELRGLITLAYVIKNNSNLYQQYTDYISVMEKLAGQEDNISIADIVSEIGSNSLDNYLSTSYLSGIRTKLTNLNKEKIKKVFGANFQTPEKFLKRVFFLSSTYSISGDIFSKLVHINGANSKRPFPRALDVPAVFGNKTAKNIIINEYKDNEKWSDYLPRLEQLQTQFSNFTNWNNNYGFKGVQTALSATAEESNYPDFMKSDAYNRKELSTALSSWTNIKHDLILYQEKPSAAEGGQGGGPEPPKHYSYVEPNVKFWENALELVSWLEELSEKSSYFNEELKKIKDIGILLKDISYKELDNEKITSEEYDELHYIGGNIEYILLGLLGSDFVPVRERSMALIADVYIYNNSNLNVAIGNADDIYVIVPIKGEYYIARGSVFSFYEFKGKIYNDEEWKEIIKENTNIPPRPEWLQPLINNIEPLTSQTQYRYFGSD